MKHIRGPNPKYFVICAILTMFLLCAPANATTMSAPNNMIPAGDSNLAMFQNEIELNSATTLAIPFTAWMKEGGVTLTRNSVWRLARLNAANENSRLYYFSIDLADAIVPRKTMLPLLN